VRCLGCGREDSTAAELGLCLTCMDTLPKEVTRHFRKKKRTDEEGESSLKPRHSTSSSNQ